MIARARARVCVLNIHRVDKGEINKVINTCHHIGQHMMEVMANDLHRGQLCVSHKRQRRTAENSIRRDIHI